MAQRTASPIRFSGTLLAIDRATILRLPANASQKLPSRGQVAVQGTINGHPFETVVEPDGKFGHWLKIDERLQRAARIRSGDDAVVQIEPAEAWPEPDVPRDL